MPAAFLFFLGSAATLLLAGVFLAFTARRAEDQATPGGEAPPRAARRARVLLADPDPALVALVSRMLATRGHEVMAAASALEARQQAASFPGEVDVILAGLHLGRDNGIAVLGEVRRTSPLARAVILSSEAEHGDVDHLLDAGVELVRRPVPPEAIVEVVERAAYRSPVRRPTATA
jgi:CheY-like chemotaxis protein